MNENVNTVNLANELIYRGHLMQNSRLPQNLKGLSMSEYIALHTVAQTAQKESIYAGRTYLQDMCDKMQMSIHRVSKIIGELKDKGLVTWAHDGNGNEGTYVTITPNGIARMKHQEETLRTYYRRVIEKYGQENMVQLLQMMKQLDAVMSSVLEEMEGTQDGSRTED